MPPSYNLNPEKNAVSALHGPGTQRSERSTNLAKVTQQVSGEWDSSSRGRQDHPLQWLLPAVLWAMRGAPRGRGAVLTHRARSAGLTRTAATLPLPNAEMQRAAGGRKDLGGRSH